MDTIFSIIIWLVVGFFKLLYWLFYAFFVEFLWKFIIVGAFDGIVSVLTGNQPFFVKMVTVILIVGITFATFGAGSK